MWILKCKFENKENILNILSNKYDLKCKGYPINTYKEKGKFILTAAGFLEGEERNIKKAVKELKKDKSIKNLELHKNFLIISIFQPKETEPLYSKGLIYVKPIKVNKDFTQEYEVAHFNREKLEKVMMIALKNVKSTILKIKNEKIKEISFLGTSPDLTEKQKNSLKYAFENGYYNFPRNKSMLELSKDKNQPLSTFQKNLRKAEQKIMKFFLKV